MEKFKLVMKFLKCFLIMNLVEFLNVSQLNFDQKKGRVLTLIFENEFKIRIFETKSFSKKEAFPKLICF
jgi:hypothetical protein